MGRIAVIITIAAIIASLIGFAIFVIQLWSLQRRRSRTESPQADASSEQLPARLVLPSYIPTSWRPLWRKKKN
jgi:hypothetical protein